MFRMWTGIIITGFGLVFLIGGLIEREGSAIMGLVFAAIGVAIVLNKREDSIEEIKNDNETNHE